MSRLVIHYPGAVRESLRREQTAVDLPVTKWHRRSRPRDRPGLLAGTWSGALRTKASDGDETVGGVS
jgi:hypothetical protein